MNNVQQAQGIVSMLKESQSDPDVEALPLPKKPSDDELARMTPAAREAAILAYQADVDAFTANAMRRPPHLLNKQERDALGAGIGNWLAENKQ